MEESGESTKNKRGDPRRGLYLLFPVSNCHTTITPSKPPTKQKICLRIIKPKKKSGHHYRCSRKRPN